MKFRSNQKFITGFFFLIISINCNAWQCVVSKTPAETIANYLKESDAVFIGKVISIKKYDEDFDSVILEVKQNFKNVSEESVSIITNSGLFAFPFIINNEYLVYVSTKKKKLYTSVCSGTTELESVKKKEIDFLLSYYHAKYGSVKN